MSMVKKLFVILLVVLVLGGSAKAEGAPTLTVELADQVLEGIFEPVGDIESRVAKVSFKVEKFLAVMDRISPNVYTKMLEDAKFKSTDENIGLLNNAASAGNYTSEVVGWLRKLKGLTVGASEEVSETLGHIGLMIVLMKVGHDYAENGDIKQAVLNNKHNIGELMAGYIAVHITKAAYKTGNPYLVALAAGIWVHGLTKQIEESNSPRNSMERSYQSFSEKHVSYRLGRKEFRSSGTFEYCEWMPNVDERMIFRPELDSDEFLVSWDSYDPWKKILDDIFKEYTTRQSAFTNDYSNPDAIASEHKANSDKVVERINELLDDYASVFWTNTAYGIGGVMEPKHFRHWYMRKTSTFLSYIFDPSTPPDKVEVYKKRLKARTLLFLAPLLKEYYDDIVKEATERYFQYLMQLESDLNRVFIFDIVVYDPERAKTNKENPYIPIRESKYKNHTAVFSNPDRPYQKHILASHRAPDYWNLIKGKVGCTYLAYILYGKPRAIELYSPHPVLSEGGPKPEVVELFEFNADHYPTITIRIGKPQEEEPVPEPAKENTGGRWVFLNKTTEDKSAETMAKPYGTIDVYRSPRNWKYDHTWGKDSLTCTLTYTGEDSGSDFNGMYGSITVKWTEPPATIDPLADDFTIGAEYDTQKSDRSRNSTLDLGCTFRAYSLRSKGRDFFIDPDDKENLLGRIEGENKAPKKKTISGNLKFLVNHTPKHDKSLRLIGVPGERAVIAYRIYIIGTWMMEVRYIYEWQEGKEPTNTPTTK